MRNAAQAAALEASPRRTVVALAIDGAAECGARELLIHRLAADHLRELRDDGVTVAYIARMYGVTPTDIEELGAELLPLRTR